MSKAKKIIWLRKHNRKWRQRQASREGNFIVREKGRLLIYKRINGIKPPPIRSASPCIMIDSERLVFAGSNRGLASFVRDYKKMPSAQSIEVIDETSTLSVEAIDQMLKAMFNHTVHPSDNTALPSA